MSLRKQLPHIERRELHPLPLSYYQQPGSHIKLERGVVVPVQIGLARGYKVLCPVLANGGTCERGNLGRRKREWFRPHLLIKNCGDPNLQLWVCEGCKDKFLLRVDVNGSSY